jgi:hypothetical protein
MAKKPPSTDEFQPPHQIAYHQSFNKQVDYLKTRTYIQLYG